MITPEEETELLIINHLGVCSAFSSDVMLSGVEAGVRDRKPADRICAVREITDVS
jgi:hypothetical protein